MEHIGPTVREVLRAWLNDDPVGRRLLLGDEGFREVERAIAGEGAPTELMHGRKVRQVERVPALERHHP